jgi:CheY-like chemotaxis protein
MGSSTNGTRRVLLADDDDDDKLLFVDVLKELHIPAKLSSAGNGEILMRMLSEGPLPELLFLDLNMPLKNGFECLEEIRGEKRFDDMPIIIFSTSSQPSAIDQVFNAGAQLYVRKPNDFTQLKKVIKHVFEMNWGSQEHKTTRENFVLTV